MANAAVVVSRHNNDVPENAITGKLILRLYGDKVCLTFLYYRISVKRLIIYLHFLKKGRQN